jgi:tetratricopeptide (TPR) repeat protein
VEEKNIRIYYLLGHFLFSMGSFAHSFEAFSKVSEENPLYLDVVEKLDALREYFRKLANLLRMHQKQEKSTPRYPDLHVKMGNILILMGKKDEAEKEFQKALEISPDYKEAQAKLKELRSGKNFPLETSLAEVIPESNGEGFEMDLSFAKQLGPKPDGEGSSAQFSLVVKNVRRNKKVTVKIPPEDFEKGSFMFDCQIIGPMLAEDLLLMQVVDDETKCICATVPHVISEDEATNRKAKQKMDTIENPLWKEPSGRNAPFKIPLQYFYVRFFCPQLGTLICGEDPVLRAEISNANTSVSAVGKCNRENLNETQFVLISENGREVVREGDKLHFELTDRLKKSLFVMDFPILKEDVDEFSKTIAIEILEQLLKEYHFPEKNIVERSEFSLEK